MRFKLVTFKLLVLLITNRLQLTDPASCFAAGFVIRDSNGFPWFLVLEVSSCPWC